MYQGLPIASAWTNHPKEYKFTGFELLYDNNVMVTARETYGFLEFAGDLGGLFDALYYVISFIISPLTSIVISSELLMSIFRVKNRKLRQVWSTNFVESKMTKWKFLKENDDVVNERIKTDLREWATPLKVNFKHIFLGYL